MDYIALITGFSLGFVIGMFYQRGKDKGNSEKGTSNLEAANAKRRKEKERAKARIMELFETKSEIQNDDVEQLLDVSDATATRYLEELEGEGKIAQIGEIGRGISYKKN